jgi:hypothetical protein
VNILITDGETRAALAATRALGRRGHAIFVAGHEKHNISARSKYCKSNFLTPSPLQGKTKYSEIIYDIVTNQKIDFILPLTEQSIYQLNKIRDRMDGRAILACAPAEAMEAVSNKYNLFRLAQSAGVPIPETTFISDPEDFFTRESRITSFPVVVKPAYSKIPVGDRIISTRVSYASDRHELQSLYESNPVLRYPSLIQELIIGPGTGLFTLFDGDCHLALFSHRRLLEKPPSGGVSVISESIAVDPEMALSAEKLLCAVGWKGVAMVEFKKDQRDGKAKLIEINGRFWGSLQLAIASGVNFPVLCLDYYLGKKPASLLSDFLVGQKLKWFLGIMDHLVIRLQRGDDKINLPPGSPSCCEIARELLKGGDSNTSFDVYNSEDLNPFVSEIKAYIKDLFRSKR